MENLNVLQVNTFEKSGGAARLVSLLNKGLNQSIRSTIYSGESIIRNQTLLDKSLSYLELYEFLGRGKALDYESYDLINFHNLHGNYFKLSDIQKTSKLKPLAISLHDKWMLNGSYPYKPDLELSKFQHSLFAPIENLLYPFYRRFMEPSLLKFKSEIYKKSKFSLIVSSKWMQTELSKSILNEKEVKVIPYGIDENIFKPENRIKIREKLKLPKDKFIVCFSASGGATNKRKGFKFAKKVIDLLSESGITFLLLGDNNWKIPNAITVDYINDDALLNEYYNASDLYLFTSLIDNSPLTLMESLASGLPVAAFNSGGVGEIIENGKNGFLVDNFDIAAISGLILTYQKDDKIHNRFRNEARNTVLEKFTQKRMVKDYLTYYKEIIHDFKK